MSKKLLEALGSVNWNENAAWLNKNPKFAERIEVCNGVVAIWAMQIERAELGNPSLSFVREMQHAGHHAACCLGVALYKSAAGAMRSMLECAMYYCYFRTHASELQTLVRDDKYYVSKKEILDFFKKHVVDYQPKQEKLGLVARLEHWYSKTSAIVHGQIPGAWSQGGSVSEFLHDSNLMAEAIQHFEAGADLVRDIFLCTIAAEIWAGVSTPAKKLILKGFAPDIRSILKLDAA